MKARLSGKIRAFREITQVAHATNLWKLPEGKCVSVRTATFTEDFGTILLQLFQEAEPRRHNDLPDTVQVCGEPIGDFEKWAQDMTPEWDRYEHEAELIAIKKGLVSKQIVREENGVGGRPNWQNRLDEATQMSLYEEGLKLYLDGLIKGIQKPSEEIPPLIRIHGRPVDGRHRTWAAMRMGKKIVPVISVP
jgi:hypothetical protein